MSLPAAFQGDSLKIMKNAHLSGMYEWQFSKLTCKDLLSDEPSVMTDRNLFEPLAANRGMRGGWREKRLRADRLNAGLSAVLAAATVTGIGLVLLSRKHHAH